MVLLALREYVNAALGLFLKPGEVIVQADEELTWWLLQNKPGCFERRHLKNDDQFIDCEPNEWQRRADAYAREDA